MGTWLNGGSKNSKPEREGEEIQRSAIAGSYDHSCAKEIKGEASVTRQQELRSPNRR